MLACLSLPIPLGHPLQRGRNMGKWPQYWSLKGNVLTLVLNHRVVLVTSIHPPIGHLLPAALGQVVECMIWISVGDWKIHYALFRLANYSVYSKYDINRFCFNANSSDLQHDYMRINWSSNFGSHIRSILTNGWSFGWVFTHCCKSLEESKL